MPHDLKKLFNPTSVAVIGASRSPKKVGAIVLRNIIESGFKGKIYPINHKAKTIGKLKCYEDISLLPETPDLAVVVIPASAVLEELVQTGEKGVKNVVVISAGFKEVGDEGKKLEEELVKISMKYEMNLLGPNCLGFVNNPFPINATFAQLVTHNGNLRFISQSGAIASSIFDWCQETGLGFADFVTLGNKADLNENEILEYFENNPVDESSFDHLGLAKVTPIGLYLESITQGDKFLDIASRLSQTNPILVLKPGKTTAAKSAMQSHTGAIAGEDAVLEAVLKQAGLIRCNTLEEFFDLSRAFAWEDIPDGPNVAVISNAGGPAVISADAVINEGLTLAEFDDETKAHLAETLPRSASIINPVDVLGDALADRYAQSAEVILQKDDVHALVVILTPQVMTEIKKTAKLIGNLSNKYKKPIFCSFIGGRLVADGEKILNEYKIPSFRFPEGAISAIGAMWQFRKQHDKHLVKGKSPQITLKPKNGVIRKTIQQAVNKNQKTLDNLASNEILASVDIPTPPTKFVTNFNEARGFANKHGWPVVLKLSSPGLLHKKDVGGVITDVGNEEELENALHQLERKTEQLDERIKKDIKIQIQKDIQHGVEVIVGAKHDPTFGPVLLFGAGGSLAELISDRNLHLLPINLAQVKELVKESKIYEVLKGHRGDPPYALDKLYDVILRVSKLIDLIPEATDIEINPVIVTLNNAWAVDAKIVLKQGIKRPTTQPKFKVAKCLSHKVLATQFHYYEIEGEEPLIFKPGQYISVKVADDAIRAYSIATHSSPTKFNLLVDTRPGGPGSKFFENLKVNDKIPYMGPFGVFSLNLEDGADQLLFLATGSGGSAIRCMIDHALIEKNEKRPITLYFGFTYPKEIFWKDHFDYLTQKYPNFNYEYVVFEPDDSWQGCTGYVTKNVSDNFKDASKTAAYLCGHRAMIANATDILVRNGCPKERVYTERFV